MPCASLGNPRTLDLYAYVSNNPTTQLDPDGHAPERAGNYAQDMEMQSDDGLSDEFADTSAQLGDEGGDGEIDAQLEGREQEVLLAPERA